MMSNQSGDVTEVSSNQLENEVAKLLSSENEVRIKFYWLLISFKYCLDLYFLKFYECMFFTGIFLLLQEY